MDDEITRSIAPIIFFVSKNAIVMLEKGALRFKRCRHRLEGDVLCVVEAMKMENEIVAPQDGTVASVNTSVGEQVEAGAVLATLN